MPAVDLKYAVLDGYDALPEDEVIRRLQLLARTQAGERPLQIAADLGVTSRQVRRWTAWARNHVRVSWAADQRKRRRRMLEMRNAGHSYGVIADAFGVSESMVGNALPIAWREAYADVDGWGPPAEPLLDWLRQLPLEDAAGDAGKGSAGAGGGCHGAPGGAAVAVAEVVAGGLADPHGLSDAS